MATPNHTKRGKLAKKAAELGLPIEVMMRQAIEGSETIGQAADRLGVTDNAVQWWLMKNRYTVQIEVRRELRLVRQAAHE